jgi:hypothetical protein
VTSLGRLPDPDTVASAETFGQFVGALADSLDEALTIELTSPWDDTRGEWVTWTLSSFIDGIASWIKSSGRLPLDRENQRIWAVIIPAYGIWDGGEDELRRYLVDVQAWAAAVDPADAEPWHEAAEAMAAAAAYE